MPTPRAYLLNGVALLILLGLTIGAAHTNLGPLNTPVALSISSAKAALIILFFMNLRHSKPLIWVCAGAGFFWLAIMIVLAMSDYLARGWR